MRLKVNPIRNSINTPLVLFCSQIHLEVIQLATAEIRIHPSQTFTKEFMFAQGAPAKSSVKISFLVGDFADLIHTTHIGGHTCLLQG